MSHASSVNAFIGIGSNMEGPAEQVRQAFELLATLPVTRLVRCSSLYRSAPVGYAEQPDYVNAVALVQTGLTARALLEELLAVEHRRGRVRLFQDGPRVLDLDVLMYDRLVCHEEGLIVPHPRMHERAFVLVPLLEIAPQAVIPGQGAVSDLVVRCAGQEVERLPDPVPA